MMMYEKLIFLIIVLPLIGRAGAIFIDVYFLGLGYRLQGIDPTFN